MSDKTKEIDKIQKEYNSQLEWIRFREDALGPDVIALENTGSKFGRKMKENPFVPIGALATFAALSYGLWCFRKGKSQQSQNMMRARIGAQGFTIFAILGGIMFGSSTVSDTSKKDSKSS